MKKNITRFFLVTSMLLGISWASEAQIVVKVRPMVPHVESVSNCSVTKTYLD